MIKIAIIGLGKMGLSHTALLGAHPKVDLVAVCDTSSMVLNGFKRYNKSIKLYEDFNEMYAKEQLDAVLIATPTKLHYLMAKPAIEKGVHVFCEKPFSLTLEQGEELVAFCNEKKVINQVGYHNHFIGTFREMKRLLAAGILGDQFHFTGEAYGPVVTKPKGGSWRAKPEEGGGCLFDYASHVLNLIQEVIGKPTKVKGTLLKRFYSKEVEDGVFSSLILDSGLSGTLSVNWSDETYRKMSTSLMVIGDKGKIICDATELKVYLKEENKTESLPKGWSIKYITDLALPIDFYLRGEEYSAQIDYFIDNVEKGKQGDINTFEQALYTDKVIEMLKTDSNE
ncbi:Gfo/Idh/MocA family oxidoreductase [Prolixibacteraceae bacterium Z1-6]|uniref:Gfo/Idh/MocA family oxidoreductase n=1 Tax=Draconibacterium aestuarii TaxID=2998507 RepID=A0A9X3F219_9BACT|nr:Gfo/Idh/MocA family oxidoreductase [Prolixibacteraceae bacterium Z1-6]